MSAVWTNGQQARVKTPTYFQRGITPETTASLIEAIANDKATRLQALAKTSIILTITPEWAQVEEINAIFGVPINQIKQLAIDGKVVAKKTNPSLTSSAVIFKVSDVRKAIGDMTDYSTWLEERPDLKTQKEAQHD